MILNYIKKLFTPNSKSKLKVEKEYLYWKDKFPQYRIVKFSNSDYYELHKKLPNSDTWNYVILLDKKETQSKLDFIRMMKRRYAEETKTMEVL